MKSLITANELKNIAPVPSKKAAEVVDLLDDEDDVVMVVEEKQRPKARGLSRLVLHPCNNVIYGHRPPRRPS